MAPATSWLPLQSGRCAFELSTDFVCIATQNAVFLATQGDEGVPGRCGWCTIKTILCKTDVLLWFAVSKNSLGMVEKRRLKRSFPELRIDLMAFLNFCWNAVQTVLAPTLTRIFNTSIVTGTVPHLFKKATITHIHKSGDKSQAGKYRPISLLPIVSKIVEKVVSTKFKEYLNEHKFLPSEQFAYLVTARVTLLRTLSPLS